MKTCTAVSVSGLVAALLMPAQLLAATPSHQCAQLWDDVLRLSCYDTAFGKPRPPGEAAAAQSTSAPAATVPATSTPPVSAAAGAPAAVAAAAAAAAPAAPAANQPTAKATEKKGGDVTGAVTAVSQLLDGRLRVTLDNGQVWQQTEVEAINRVRAGGELPQQLFEVKVGDQVTVKSGFMGARQMIDADGRSARVTQVRQ